MSEEVQRYVQFSVLVTTNSDPFTDFKLNVYTSIETYSLHITINIIINKKSAKRNALVPKNNRLWKQKLDKYRWSYLCHWLLVGKKVKKKLTLSEVKIFAVSQVGYNIY